MNAVYLPRDDDMTIKVRFIRELSNAWLVSRQQTQSNEIYSLVKLQAGMTGSA